tara:strand:- start:28 stop:840 length:813 start_codon:yes stop_codon:yes gene_type:complete
MYLQSDNATIDNGESNKTFLFKNAIEPLPDQDILVGLTDFEMANTLYNINTGFNSIVIDNQTITLTPKNYTIDFLILELNDLFDANTTLKTKNMAVSYDINSFKLTFTADSNFIINSSTMDFELGLENQLPTNAATSYETNNTIFLGGLSSVYIEIKNLSLNNLDSRGPIDNTLAKINMRKNNGYYTFYDAPEHNFFKVNNREIHSIDIVLTDSKNRELILNGGEFSLTLTFHFIKKRQDIYDLKYYLKKDIIISDREKRENERKNLIEE